MQSEKTVTVYSPQGNVIYKDTDKKNFKSTSADAAVKMVETTADSNLDLMKVGMRGVTDYQKNQALAGSNTPREQVLSE